MEKIIRIFAGFCVAVFASVGLIFLLIPQGVLSFFNVLSGIFNIPLMPVADPGFYLILAVAYMYVVTVISWFIYREPGNPLPLFLLGNAKIASSLLSLLLMIKGFYLVFLANFIIDGLIGLVAFYFYRKVKR